MSDSKKSSGSFGCIVGLLFLAALFWVFRLASRDAARMAEIEAQSQAQRQNQAQRQKMESKDAPPDGLGFTTMDAQLAIALAGKKTITQIRLEGTPAPLEGPWMVKGVGDDVVVFEGSAGLMTVRMKAIVSIQVKPETAPAIPPEPQVEK
jgi:glucose/arabinose dehydrogenase